MPILPSLSGPADLRGLDEVQLAQLALEIRETIIATVAHTGGHLGSSLGVVELTIALHRLLESPRDRIVWDTGHQAYPHKLLTGRLERFGTLRQLDGIGGFPRRSESPHDVFDGGHAGTGLSIAEGLAEARDIRHGLERIAVVVGDAALMSGLSLEALNDIGQRQTQMLIVVNDNEMSISPTVGAFSRYLSQIKLSQAWRQSKSAYDRTVERIPVVGPTLLEWSQPPARLGRALRPARAAVRGPRHHLHRRRARPRPARADRDPRRAPWRCPGRRSSTSGPRRAAATGRPRPTRSASTVPRCRRWPPVTGQRGNGIPADRVDGRRRRAALGRSRAAAKKLPNYTAVFAAELMDLARTDRRIVGITAGMPTGTGLSRFQAEFPDRFFDVGIAEQHAMTFATGLALGGLRPVVALYSTFLQRAFDQTVHDVCQNDQPVADRGGPGRPRRRGRDQPPGDVHAARPAAAAEPGDRLAARRAGAALDGPDGASPRTTRSPCTTRATRASGCDPVEPAILPIGRGEVLREGRDLLFVGFGPIVARAMEAADRSRPRAGRSASSTRGSPSHSTAS